jgi:hypothetical protein
MSYTFEAFWRDVDLDNLCTKDIAFKAWSVARWSQHFEMEQLRRDLELEQAAVRAMRDEVYKLRDEMEVARDTVLGLSDEVVRLRDALGERP